jgi:hypothetical protein
MLIALRRDAQSGATLPQRIFCWIIKARLVSQFCHGGIVIDGSLYHITASHGWSIAKTGEWSPDKWYLKDVGGNDARALATFLLVSTPPRGRLQHWLWTLLKGYDFFGLVAFTGPKVGVVWLNYCFEWCWLAVTGVDSPDRVTPEMLVTLPSQ